MSKENIGDEGKIIEDEGNEEEKGMVEEENTGEAGEGDGVEIQDQETDTRIELVPEEPVVETVETQKLDAVCNEIAERLIQSVIEESVLKALKELEKDVEVEENISVFIRGLINELADKGVPAEEMLELEVRKPLEPLIEEEDEEEDFEEGADSIVAGIMQDLMGRIVQERVEEGEGDMAISSEVDSTRIVNELINKDLLLFIPGDEEEQQFEGKGEDLVEFKGEFGEEQKTTVPLVEVTTDEELEPWIASEAEDDESSSEEEDSAEIPIPVPEPAPEPVPPEEQVIMEPDNPLMVRFQATLRSHLLKQKSRVEEEILNLKGDIRERQLNQEQVSSATYNVELQLFQQQQTMDRLSASVQEISDSWQNVINCLAQVEAENYKVKLVEIEAARKKEEELRMEVETLSALVQQLSILQSNQEAEMNVSKLLTHRQKSEKKRLLVEKQKQDMLLWGLNREVLKLTTAYKEMEGHIKRNIGEMEKVGQTVADATVDVGTLAQENAHLLVLWERVTMNVEKRDRALYTAKQMLTEYKAKYEGLECELINQKKECRAEIRRNEQLTIQLKEMEKAIQADKRAIKREEEKRDTLEEELARVAKMRQFTENDFDASVSELRRLDREISLFTMEWEKVKQENQKLEQAIVDRLQEQAVESKTAKQYATRIKHLRNLLREKEVVLASVENKITRVMVETENQKAIYACDEAELKAGKQELREKQGEVSRLQAELERTMNAAQQTQANVNKHQLRLETLKERLGECELSPEEVTLREMEKNIAVVEERTEEMQQFWLRQENHIVRVSQQRTQQLHQISVLRKQLLILDQKNLKIEWEARQLEKEGKVSSSKVQALQKQQLRLGELTYQRKGRREQLDDSNLNIQNQFISDLKEAETQSSAMRQVISEAVEKKEELYRSVEERQRELLAWEKKLQMATETRENMAKLHGEGGEVANMKSEIHRMEVRFSQLKKAQEKLIQDMELSVSRRDGIVEVALAREKRVVKGGQHYNRTQFQKKVDDLKNRAKHMASELKSLEKECLDRERRREELSDELRLKMEQLEGLRKAAQQMDLQLAEGHLHRQKNLEVLVRLQRKARHYIDLKGTRYRLLFRNESSLEIESQKQRTVNADLISVVEALLLDFPSLQMSLTAVINTLRICAAN